LRAAKGDSVAVLDGDLQDPPECLTDLISRLNTSPPVDVVFAVKQGRTDPIWLKTGSHLYHLALRGMGRSLPSGAGSYCVMRHPIAETVSQLQNTHLNLAIAVAVQRPVWATLPYAKAARHDGRSRVGALGLVAEAMGSLCYAARSR
jgi:dolichol-phosphate mannosyltransferase